MSDRLPCFKAYDIRGRVPDELDADLVRRIGAAYVQVVRPSGPVAAGHDSRLSGPELTAALVEGLTSAGGDAVSLGLCGTELVYHAASLTEFGGGIMVTASHNPADQNGLKLVRRDPVRGVVLPVTDDTGLLDIEALARAGDPPRAQRGRVLRTDLSEAYLDRVLSFVEGTAWRPLKVVVDSGHGAAGPTVDRLAEHLPFELIRLHHQPDGRFPAGVPNPLLPENRHATSQAVIDHGADLGVAWDGDFDRCFLYDERGEFVEGYYVVGLLAETMLARHPGGRIIHDPRLYWNTLDIVASSPGGVALKCRTGHARIKAMMVARDGLYGGEMSAHHYFRDFAYCDTGMVPWLLAAALMSTSGRSLADLVADRMARFPCSGEISRRVSDPEAAFQRVMSHFAPERPAADFFDGLSLIVADRWRMNLRQSDTQPELLRLNVESRGDRSLMEAKTAEVLAVLDEAG